MRASSPVAGDPVRRLRGVLATLSIARLGLPESQPLDQSLELLLGLGGLVAQALRGNLRLRHEISDGPQARVDLRLLAGALAQLAGHLLARAGVLTEVTLELLHARVGGLRGVLDRSLQTLRERRRRGVGRTLGAQALDPPRSLVRIAGRPLGLVTRAGSLVPERRLRKRPLDRRPRGALRFLGDLARRDRPPARVRL